MDTLDDKIKEQKRFWSRAYYQRHKEKILKKNKERYYKDPEKTRLITKKANVKRITKIREYAASARSNLRRIVLEIKNKNPCKCGENHVSCLLFHHRDPEQKELTINVVIKRAWAVERMMKEIEKCDILCFNCHAKLHWEEREQLKQVI